MFIKEYLTGHHVNKTGLKTEVLIITHVVLVISLFLNPGKKYCSLDKNPRKIRSLKGKNT